MVSLELTVETRAAVIKVGINWQSCVAIKGQRIDGRMYHDAGHPIYLVVKPMSIRTNCTWSSVQDSFHF